MLLFFQQHSLRLMAFGQIYKVLEMEPLPSNKPSQKYPWSDKEGVCICWPACLLGLLLFISCDSSATYLSFSLCLPVSVYLPLQEYILSLYAPLSASFSLWFCKIQGFIYSIIVRHWLVKSLWHIIYLSGPVKLFLTTGSTVSGTDKWTLKNTFKDEMGCLIFDTVALEKCLQLVWTL